MSFPIFFMFKESFFSGACGDLRSWDLFKVCGGLSVSCFYSVIVNGVFGFGCCSSVFGFPLHFFLLRIVMIMMFILNCLLSEMSSSNDLFSLFQVSEWVVTFLNLPRTTVRRKGKQ